MTTKSFQLNKAADGKKAQPNNDSYTALVSWQLTLVNLRGSVSFKCSKFLFMQGHSVKMVYCQYLGIGVEGKEFSFTQS